MSKVYLTIILLAVTVLVLPLSIAYANAVYPFEVFTNNGDYCNSPELDMYVEVSNGADQIDFTFYNDSCLGSSIARIYFDNGALLGASAITGGPGTSFNQLATPSSLPAGNMLEPPFVTANGFSFGSETPRPHNGINPGEWVRITFNLDDDGSFAAVINELNSAALRIGVHIIALPDGSSESAIAVPEPATIILLGLGGLALLYKRTA